MRGPLPRGPRYPRVHVVPLAGHVRNGSAEADFARSAPGPRAPWQVPNLERRRARTGRVVLVRRQQGDEQMTAEEIALEEFRRAARERRSARRDYWAAKSETWAVTATARRLGAAVQMRSLA